MDFIPGRCSYQLMIKLILAAGLAGCCLGMAQGQDVASPSMPNVDGYRQTPEFARERAAVARYMFFWTLCGRIAILESDIKGNVNAGLLCKRLLNLLPENISAGCPEMFRKEWMEHVEKIKAALNENPEWMETPQGKKECAAIEAVMKRLDERYGIERAIYLSNEWLDKRLETGKRNDAPEIFLKDLLRLKKDFKSGRLAVPVEFISQERKEG